MCRPQTNEIKKFQILHSMHKCICAMSRPVASRIAHASTYNHVSRPLASRMSVLSFVALFNNFGCNFHYVISNEMSFEALEFYQVELPHGSAW